MVKTEYSFKKTSFFGNVAAFVLLAASLAFSYNSFDMQCDASDADRLVCTITQYNPGTRISDAENDADGYPAYSGELTSWEDVAAALEGVEAIVANKRNDLEISDEFVVEIKLGSDIVFDAIDMDNPSCPTSLAPLSQDADVIHVFNGNGKTIRYFCQDEDLDGAELGFLKNIHGIDTDKGKSRILDVTFDQAYIRSKGSVDNVAAVVASTADMVTFVRDTVMNSVVLGWNVAGVVARSKNCAFSDVDVENVTLETQEDVFSDALSDDDLKSLSLKGGVAAGALNSGFEQVTLKKLKMSHYAMKDPNGNLLTGRRYMGGVFGVDSITGAMSASSHSLTAEELSFVNGSHVGGAIGELLKSGNGTPQNQTFENSSITEMSVSVACLDEVHVGGMMGSSDAVVSFSRDTVSFPSGFDYTANNCDASLLEHFKKRQIFFGGILGEGLTNTESMDDKVFSQNIVYAGAELKHESADENFALDYVGGIVGRVEASGVVFAANKVYSNLSSDVYVELNMADVVAPTVDDASRIYAGNLAGFASAGSRGLYAVGNYTDCDIRVEGSSMDKGSLHVGGLFGFAATTETDASFAIQFNRIDGSFTASIDGETSRDVGFAVGLASITGLDENKITLSSNLYMSDDDLNQIVGYSDVDLDNVRYKNYRNSVDGELDPTGVLSPDGEGGIVDFNGAALGNSGVLPVEEIRTLKFLYVMNQGFDESLCPMEFCSEYGYQVYFHWSDAADPMPVASAEDLLYIPYRKKIDVTDIYGSFTDDDLVAVENYYVMRDDPAASSKERLLYDFTKSYNSFSDEFADVMNSLSFAPAFRNDDGNFMGMNSLVSEKLVMVRNYRLFVSYEVKNADGEYVPLEEMDPYVVFFIPRAVEVNLIGSEIKIPDAKLLNNMSSVEKIYVNCKKSATSCTDISEPISAATFSQATQSIAGQFTGDHTDTLHLVYGLTDDHAKIYVARKPEKLKFASYGVDNDGYDAEINFAYFDESSADVQNLAWGGKFAPRARSGYKLKDWSADIWLSDWENFEAKEVVGCYEGQRCNQRITVALSGNGIPLSNEDDLISRMETLPEGGALRWSMKNLEPDAFIELIDFQSAAIKTVGSDKVPLIYVDAEEELIKYHVTFEPEMSSDYFYSMINGELDWKDSAVYDVEMDFDLRMFPRVYMVGNYAGWSYDDRDPRWEFSEGEVEYYDENPILRVKALVREDGQDGSGDDGIPGVFLRYEDGAEYLNEKGEVHLTQYLHPDMPMDPHKFDDAGMMAIPNEEVNFPFVVEPHPYRGYKIDSLWSTYSTMNENEPVRVDLMPEDSRNIVINPMNVFNWMLHARYASIRYDLVFNLDRNKENLHLLDWADSLTLYVDDGKEHDFPILAFNNDGCILGWKNAKSDSLEFTSEDEGFTTLDHWYDNGVWPVYRCLVEGRNELHAVWADAARCDTDVYGDDERSGSYSRVVFDTVGGVIELRMLLRDDDGTVVDSILLNSPGKDYVLVPSNFNGEDITVHFASKPGFEVPDSVLVYRDLSRNAYDDSDEMELMGSIHDGDSWPFSWDFAYVSAKFISQDSTKLAFEKFGPLDVYGVSARLKLSTNKFSVDRGVKMRVSLMDALGNELDAMVVDRIPRAPFDTTWAVFPLTPGEYVMKGMMWDARDTAVTEEERFTVSTEIAATKGGWEMVALSDVIKDSVNWTDGDQLFFWWNENARTGKYWQYEEFDSDDSVSRLQGYWYNTLEGRALKTEPTASLAENFEWEVDSAYSGWNMVANPYAWAIKVPDNLDVHAWDKESASYYKPELIRPYGAVWIHTGKRMHVSVDAYPAFPEDDASDEPLLEKVAPMAKRVALKAANRENWTVQAVLSDNHGHKDYWNILGVGQTFEGFKPPSGMGDHVELAIVNGKNRLSQSIVAPRIAFAKSAAEMDEVTYQWTLDLAATENRVGFLKLNGLKELNSMGLHAFVTVDGKTAELVAGDSLKVMLKSEGVKAQVLVTTKSKVFAGNTIEGVRFTQSGGMLNVGFNVSDDLAGSVLKVDVLNMDGKVMATYSGKAVAGSNAASFEAPRSGLYMLRVRVAREQTAGKIMVK